jgi:serine/threonine-protein kinase
MSEDDSRTIAASMRPSAVSIAVGHVPPAIGEVRDAIDLSPHARLVPKKHIAMGGMGEVTEVCDVALSRPLAKKALHVDLQRDPKNQRMFLREARVTGQLEHPNIVPVHELGLDAEGRIYFTMKRVEGKTIADLVRALPKGPFERGVLFELLEVVVRVCDALAYAHARGVVHCDLKASNVMVGEFGEVYLMDWGIARLLSEATSSEGAVTDGLPPSPHDAGPAISGTPSFMAPEQARGDTSAIDARTDVFAAGALLYEIVSGHAPYSGPHMAATIMRAAFGERAPLADSERGATLPPELASIIDRAMAYRPTDRYQSVRELRTDLVRFIRGGLDFPRTSFPAGAEIVREGDDGHAAYRIVRGTCHVFRGHGEERVFVREMGEGESFGEMAILSPGPRTATVVAVTDVEAEVVTRGTFEQELASMKPWLAAVVRTLADRFRERSL